jgi:hypothetical protein
MAAKRQKYTVLSPVRTGGRLYRIGELLELTEVEAAELLASPYPILQPSAQQNEKPSVFVPAEPEATPGKRDHADVETPKPPIIIKPDPAPDPALGPEAAASGELQSTETEEGDEEGVSTPPPLVSINTATVEELAEAFKQVNGIGRGSAQAIVENRPYTNLGDVLDQADLVGTARSNWPKILPFISL